MRLFDFAEKLEEQLKPYTKQEDFSETEIKIIRDILQAASYCYKIEMAKKYGDGGYSGGYGYSGARNNYTGHWEEPHYYGRYTGDYSGRYTGNYDNRRYSGAYNEDTAQKELLEVLQKVAPHIQNRELKEMAQDCLQDFNRR